MRIGKWLLHEWHLGRGISAIQRGDYDRALLHLDRALIYMPQSIWASLYKAYSAVCAGDEGMARGLLNIAVEDIGERPGVLVLAGRVWYELGELDTADCAFAKALELNPDNIVATSYRALIAFERDDFDAGVNLLCNRIIADDMKLQVRMLMVLEKRAMAYRQPSACMEGDAEEFTKVGAPRPSASTATCHTSLTSALCGWWYAWRGMHHLERRQLDDAISWLERALELRPNDSQLQLALCAALLEAGEPYRAHKILSMVPREHPDYPLYAGATLSALGQLDEAEALLKNADVTFALTHYYRGLVHLQRNAWQDAQVAFTNAYTLDPALIRLRIHELIEIIASENAE